METVNTGRRGFLKGIALAGAAYAGRGAIAAVAAEDAKSDPLVGGKWPGWTKGHFQLHAIHTGVAESMFLIYPDGTTMLLDCGDHPAINRGKLAVPVLPNGTRHAGEWVARYVTRVNPSGAQVDYMVTSHFHSDHTGCMIWGAGLSQHNLPRSGFAQAAETLSFGKAVDRGWPNYDDPLPFDDYEKYGSRELMVKLYRILQRGNRDFKAEKFRIGATDQLGPRKDPAACPGFKVKNLCANGKVLMKDGSVKDLYADHIRRDRLRILNENGMSLGMVITYGKFRLYTAGDFEDNWKLPDGSTYYTENDLADAVPRVDVAKVNHHGHRSMREKLVKALSPRVWLSCVWDQLHDTPDTMERIDRAYADERTYCPCVFPAERRWQDKDAVWIKDVAPESFGGAHVILDVPPGGETYTITHLDASDEEMKVIGVRHFRSQGE